MDDDPLEFEVDREGVRMYLRILWFFGLGLPGFWLAIVFSNAIARVFFGPFFPGPSLVFSFFLGTGWAYTAVRLSHRIAPVGAAALRYWIDAGHNLRVEDGLLFHRRLTMPMDRIDDITVGQNPITRWCGIWGMKVRYTGGQRQGSTVLLLGLKSPEKIRDLLLDERRKALREIQAERYA